MLFLIRFLSVVEALCGILLVGLILLQKSKSHGAAAGMAFGAGMGESLFGAQATNVLQKMTVVLAIGFLVNTTLLAVLGGHLHSKGHKSVTDSLPPSAAPMESRANGGAARGIDGAGPIGPIPPMEGVAPSADMPMTPAAAPASGAATEPVKIDIPAPAPAPAQGADAGQKPAQP